MPVYDTLVGLWDGMSTDTQDATVLALLLLPTLVIGMVTLWGFAPWPIVVAIILRHRWIAGTFAVLIAVSVGLGI
ncbi:MAG: ABC transporter permease, partial [Pseudomonadota bacterium]